MIETIVLQSKCDQPAVRVVQKDRGASFYATNRSYRIPTVPLTEVIYTTSHCFSMFLSYLISFMITSLVRLKFDTDIGDASSLFSAYNARKTFFVCLYNRQLADVVIVLYLYHIYSYIVY